MTDHSSLSVDLDGLFTSIDLRASSVPDVPIPNDLRDVLSELPKPNYRHNILHFELLLGEALRQLERCFGIRGEWERLARERDNEELHHDMTVEREAILDEEIAAGLNDIDLTLLEREVQTLDDIIERIATTAVAVGHELTGVSAEVWPVVGDGHPATFPPSLNAPADPGPVADGPDADDDPEPARASDGSATPRTIRIDGAGRTAYLNATGAKVAHRQRLEALARTREAVLLDGETFDLMDRLEALHQEQLRLEGTRGSEELRKELTQVLVDTRARRLQLRRHIDARRQAKFTIPGHPWNLANQLDRLEDRFRFELEGAAERVYCARAGIRHAFELDEADGPNPIPDTASPEGSELDRLYRTTRALTEELSILSRSDQEATVRISVASVLGVEPQHALGSMLDQGPIRFRVQRSVFTRSKSVRLQSVSASAAGTDVGFLHLRLDAPDQRIPLRPLTTMQALGVRPTRSHTVPTFLLGTVAEHRPDAVPDTVGGLGVMNVNPVGEWTIDVHGPRDSLGERIGDLYLDLHVVLTPEG